MPAHFRTTDFDLVPDREEGEPGAVQAEPVTSSNQGSESQVPTEADSATGRSVGFNDLEALVVDPSVSSDNIDINLDLDSENGFAVDDSSSELLDIDVEGPALDSVQSIDQEVQESSSWLEEASIIESSSNDEANEAASSSDTEFQGEVDEAPESNSINLPEPTVVGDFVIVESLDEAIKENSDEAEAIRSGSTQPSENRNLPAKQLPEHLASRVADSVVLYDDDEPAESELDIPQQSTARGFVKRWAVRVVSWVKRIFRR